MRTQETDKKVRVFLVDEHPIVRRGLKFTIRRERDMTVCGEAGDRQGALEKISAARPDVAIVALKFKGSDGLDLVKDLRARCPDVRTLVFSMHDESMYAERAIRAGASGYISKDEPAPKILHAVRRVHEGEIYWSERLAARLATRNICPTRCDNGFDVECLSQRELQVFEMIGSGATTAQIAAVLHIDESTVGTYRDRVKVKLHLKDATELLQKAIRWDLAMAAR